ncbi:hypothetical protein TYRP_017614, partial [Tyrophagus putrescentiae]
CLAGFQLSFAFCSPPSVCASLSDGIGIEEIKAAATLCRQIRSKWHTPSAHFHNIFQQVHQKQYRKKDAMKKAEEEKRRKEKEQQEAEKRHREQPKKLEDEKRRQEKEKKRELELINMTNRGNR